MLVGPRNPFLCGVAVAGTAGAVIPIHAQPVEVRAAFVGFAIVYPYFLQWADGVDGAAVRAGIRGAFSRP